MIMTPIRKTKRLDVQLPPEIIKFLEDNDGTFREVTIISIGGDQVEAHLTYTIEEPLENNGKQLSLTPPDLLERQVVVKPALRKDNKTIGRIKHVDFISDPNDPACTVLFHHENSTVSAGSYRLSQLDFFMEEKC